jgi:NitT/TauT family transport system substrate-binding protein
MVRIFSVALGAVGVALTLACLAEPARALDQVTFGTDWQAEAEHGGYYQALATGIYEK